MRYGFYLPTRGPTATREGILALAREGERLGLHSAMIADHIVLPQPSVLRNTFRFLSGERLCVTGFEITSDCGATQRIINKDKPPRLAQPHGWRQTSQFEHLLDRAVW